MERDTLSILSNRKTKSMVEKTAAMIFRGCAVVSIVAVLSITVYMFISGTPAIFKEGLLEILFGSVWAPTADTPSFGILYIILTSIVGVFIAICIGVPIGVLTAVNMAEIANPRVRKIMKSAIELLAGIPSVVYGLLGILLINPFMYKIELMIFANDPTHQFTGGSNLISA
ncbi:MAG: phosphate ABC transporter permease subunit PstC, partial [Coprobacillus sp.]